MLGFSPIRRRVFGRPFLLVCLAFYSFAVAVVNLPYLVLNDFYYFFGDSSGYSFESNPEWFLMYFSLDVLNYANCVFLVFLGYLLFNLKKSSFTFEFIITFISFIQTLIIFSYEYANFQAIEDGFLASVTYLYFFNLLAQIFILFYVRYLVTSDVLK